MKMRTLWTCIVVLVLLFSACIAPLTPVPSPGGGETETPTPLVISTPSDPVTIEQGLTDMITKSTFGVDRIPPPIQKLKELSDSFNTFKSELVIKQDFTPEYFNAQQATTYVLPKVGALFQLVSFTGDISRQLDLDGLLLNSKTWKDKALPIGGLLVYQDMSVNGNTLTKGAYAILLSRDAKSDALLFEIKSTNEQQKTFAGSWTLRLLAEVRQKANQPFTYVTSEQICFSQFIFQSCLQFAAPSFARSANPINDLANPIDTAVQNLVESNLLPVDVQVNRTSTFASATGLGIADVCASALKDNAVKGCLPSYVTAALVQPVAETPQTAQSRTQATRGVTQTVQGDFGVAVLEVLREIKGPIVDEAGITTTLKEGSYRLDVLPLSSGSFLGQLTPANSNSPSYILLQETDAEGIPVDPDTLKISEELTSTGSVILEPTIWQGCSRWGNLRYPTCPKPNLWRILQWQWPKGK